MYTNNLRRENKYPVTLSSDSSVENMKESYTTSINYTYELGHSMDTKDAVYSKAVPVHLFKASSIGI